VVGNIARWLRDEEAAEAAPAGPACTAPQRRQDRQQVAGKTQVTCRNADQAGRYAGISI
jgi:hypothetical protein